MSKKLFVSVKDMVKIKAAEADAIMMTSSLINHAEVYHVVCCE